MAKRSTLYIAGLEFNYEHKAVEIFVSGCTRKCKGCHNPELQTYKIGTPFRRWLDINKSPISKEWNLLFDDVWIVGGDLLCQDPDEAVEFLKCLRSVLPESMRIVLWTGEEELINVPDEIFELCDGCKLGAYRKDLKGWQAPYLLADGTVTQIKLASNNQRFLFPVEKTSCQK